MTWGNRVGFLFYAMALIMVLLGILSLPVVQKFIEMAAGDLAFLAGLSPFLKNNLNSSLALFVLCIYGFLLERVIGFGDWTLPDIKADWANMPQTVKKPLLGLLLLLAWLDLELILIYLCGKSGLYNTSLAGWQDSASLASLLWVDRVPVALVNFSFLSVLFGSVLVAHLKAPNWKRIRGGAVLDGKRTIGPATQRLVAKDIKSLRKAEQHLEKGRYIKAAREFESLGNEFYYRAAKLYMEKGQDEEAARAFEKAGDYFAGKNNLTRAGDAYFFGEHWEKAVGVYSRVTANALGNDFERINDWITRWCTCLQHLGRFEEAGMRFREQGFYDKAAEAFEKANMHTAAAECYGRVGAFDSSAKVLAKGGFQDLALMEKGKLFLQRKEFAAAAEAFEAGNHFDEAARAYEQAGIPLKVASCYLAAGRPEIAVEFFLTAGEEVRAMECYEQMADFVSAARLAAHLGIQDKQAIFFRKAGMMVSAARSYLMIGQLTDAVSCLQEVVLDNNKTVAETARILAILLEQGRHRDALACAYGLLDGKTPSRLLAPLLYHLARAHRKLGNVEKAFRYSQLVARLDLQNQAYQKEAARVSSMMGNPIINPEPAKPVGNLDAHQTNVLSQTLVGKKAQEAADSAGVPSLKVNIRLPERESEETTQTLDENSVYDITIEGELRRYQVIKELGKGGMGFVYKAMDNKLKRFVALKMLHPEHNNDPRVVLFFKREARAIAKLNHPNIVQLFDMGKEHGTFYMVMEYVKGHTLKSLSDRYPDFMRRNLVPIWYQACSGLRYAHQNGILHRDMKPSNLMWSQDRRVKILDFGLAKEVEDLNKTAQLWGTPSFMPPELFQGERASYATDIYGLGATFYMLATRRAPFSDEETAQKFSGKGLPLSPIEIDPSISGYLSDTILKCLYLDPSERFQSMDELMARLKKISRKV